MIKKLLIASVFTAASVGSSFASSDKSWDALFAKVNGTCIGLSRMDTPEASQPVVFDDATGKIAVLLRGSVGKAKNVNLVCLYDKKSGKASIAEYRWMGK